MILISRQGSPLIGTVQLPGDKSISHRAALFASLADGKSTIDNFLTAGVTKVMLNALHDLNIEWVLKKDTLIVYGKGLHGYQSPEKPLACGNSATTMRLLAGALAAGNTTASLDGSRGLRKRPMQRIVEPLRQMGFTVNSADGYPPISIESTNGKPTGMEHCLSTASAQVKTCILLAGLSAKDRTIIHEPGPSRDHTERMLRYMGAKIVIQDPYITSLYPINVLKPLKLKIPGDISSAAFLIVAALITPGSEITIRDVGLNPTRTGLLEVLLRMGADISTGKISHRSGELVGDLTVRHSNLSGTSISGHVVVRMIDEFPILAVAAAFANGDTIVQDATELRYKESDRIAVICGELQKLGVQVDEKSDGFRIRGDRSPQGGIVSSHGDHRLALALTTFGLASRESVNVHDGEIIDESFPGYVNMIKSLGGQMEMVNW